MQPSALKCIECDSFRGWRRLFGFSSTMLSLLVALVSVSTAAVPVFRNAFRSADVTRFAFATQDSDAEHVSILVNNTGTMPGTVRFLDFWIANASGRDVAVISARPRGERVGAVLIGPRAYRLVSFDVQGRIGWVRGDGERFADFLPTLTASAAGRLKCALRINFVRFDGKSGNYASPAFCRDFLGLIRNAAYSPRPYQAGIRPEFVHFR
jgi:hypothetical protein